MWFEIPQPLIKLLVSKGSIAVDGISLTVVDVVENRFSVALIPHTLVVTTLGQRQVGDDINIETDILGKYIDRLLEARVAVWFARARRVPIQTFRNWVNLELGFR